VLKLHFAKEQLNINANEKKTLTIIIPLPKELPIKSPDMVMMKEALDKYFSKHDLEIASLMPSTCQTKHFDIWYEAKIAVVFDKLISKNKNSERFQLNFT